MQQVQFNEKALSDLPEYYNVVRIYIMPSKANVKSTILPKRAQKQKQKQSVVVNVNLGKSKKSTTKSTSKSSTRKSSVLPPPIHPVYVSPIHNLNPSIYHQGHQLPNQFYNQEQSYLRAAEPSYSSPPISTKSASPVSFTQSIQNPVSSIHRPAVYRWGETLQRMPQNMPSQQSMDDLQNEIRDLNNSYSVFTGSPTSGMAP